MTISIISSLKMHLVRNLPHRSIGTKFTQALACLLVANILKMSQICIYRKYIQPYQNIKLKM